ncbi:MAG: LuxR C-terminal-related transcriptional regulator [Syntrophobacterales bacterium]|jgi:DNA-binding NarL/FixJ family response regulator|nr:LuxR C-terminal-related transcriptional regulator [Syntrophobacterales bacterium]
MNILLGSANPSVLARWQDLLKKGNSLDTAATMRELQGKCAGQIYDLVLLHRLLIDEKVFRELTQTSRQNKFFILADQPSEEEGLLYLKLGIVGYGNTYMLPVRLLEAIRVISSGGVWLGRQIIQRLIQESYSRAGNVSARDNDRLNMLTKAERRIAAGVAKGQSNLDIAAELRITERTVKAHLTSIYEKTKTSAGLVWPCSLTGHNSAKTTSLQISV